MPEHDLRGGVAGARLYSVRGWMIGLAVIVTVAAAGLCGSVLAVGLFLSQPVFASIGAPPPVLPGAEPVQIASKSGSQLHGWWVPAAHPGAGGVVLLHGVGGDRLGLVRRAEALQAQGFSVLLFDFQAHGESSGQRITFGYLEGLDAMAAVAFARARLPGQKIGAVGISLVGAAALLGPEPLNVDALVLESVFPTIDSALSNRLRVSLGPVAGPLLTPLLTTTFKVLLPPILGVRPLELRPIDRIARIHAPVLVASGTADRYTPLTEAQALFDRAPEPKRFWAVEGAGHVDLERYGPDQYWQTVLPFLMRYVR